MTTSIQAELISAGWIIEQKWKWQFLPKELQNGWAQWHPHGNHKIYSSEKAAIEASKNFNQ